MKHEHPWALNQLSAHLDKDHEPLSTRHADKAIDDGSPSPHLWLTWCANGQSAVCKYCKCVPQYSDIPWNEERNVVDLMRDWDHFPKTGCPGVDVGGEARGIGDS